LFDKFDLLIDSADYEHFKEDLEKWFFNKDSLSEYGFYQLDLNYILPRLFVPGWIFSKKRVFSDEELIKFIEFYLLCHNNLQLET